MKLCTKNAVYLNPLANLNNSIQLQNIVIPAIPLNNKFYCKLPNKNGIIGVKIDMISTQDVQAVAIGVKVLSWNLFLLF